MGFRRKKSNRTRFDDAFRERFAAAADPMNRQRPVPLYGRAADPLRAPLVLDANGLDPRDYVDIPDFRFEGDAA